MSETHIFVASGESCPICAALDGQEVEPGFHAHDGCLCQTVPREDGRTCEWTFDQIGNVRDGSGSYDVVTGFEVTVICPDGSVTGMSSSFDGHAFNAIADPFEALDAWSDGLEEAAEDIAQQLCDACPSPPPDPVVS